jgi:hypothetical protein
MWLPAMFYLFIYIVPQRPAGFKGRERGIHFTRRPVSWQMQALLVVYYAQRTGAGVSSRCRQV